MKTTNGLNFFLLFVGVIVLTLGLSISTQSLIAGLYTAPLSNPATCTSGNPGCGAPLSLSSNLVQTLQGSIWVVNSAYPTSPYGLIVEQGKVGIGTTGPGTKLEVALGASGDVQDNGITLTRGTGYIRMTSRTTSLSDFIPAIIGKPIGATGFLFRGLQPSTVSNPTFTLQAANAANNGAIAATDNAIAFRNWTTDMVTILGSGNVGIGTVSPAQKLSVAGTIESTTGGIKFPDGTTQTTAAVADGKTLKAQIFTANGTWVKPASVSTVWVTVCGGGGGGGGLGGYVYYNNGGGGGGCHIRYVYNVSADVPIVVGAGGAGSPAGSYTGGTGGGSSSFGSLTATGGGTGGTAGVPSGHAGGAGAGYNTSGTAGDGCVFGAGGAGGPSSSGGGGGGGGGGYSGAGGNGGTGGWTAGGAGSPGTGYGSGGGGGGGNYQGGGVGPGASGAGSPGVVIVEWIQ